ncbi:pentatricopeptide repeat-containing protein At1g71210, mitochondrial [Gastrolobium bilobum]|uniref:pentatricopeptide repeat-containing protein At1g71210, mitochondrial n=1 Tax=Gastrolobium bilobum TaxID=150636 RepID=UPI002AB2AF1B|nr:pentatricopeptide repeat-containing protein At1g71210, mitochondrial [Gastrolobium bilobum]
MMLSLKHVTKHRSRSFFSSILTISNNPSSSTSSSSSSSSYTCLSSPSPCTPLESFSVTRNDIADSFKTWFRTRNHTKDPLLDRIYEILASGDDFAAPLSRLSLPLSESFVLKVLRYGGDHNGDVLSRLKFFDWAGRQPGFHHTRGTFIVIFRILSRAKLMPLVLDFLHAFRKRGFGHRVRFNDTLVVGYAIAGKPEVALNLFGEMRFKGLDLDSYSYHILLNALVEEKCFDAFDAILKQIRLRGYENRFTYVIVVKCLCRRGRLKQAEAYLKGLLGGGKELNGSEVGFLVGALCQSNRFDRAVKLVVELGNSAFVPLENAYGVWIRSLVRRGMLDEALEFYRQKKDSEGYVPDLARYNILICRLLSENRLLQVYDLLVDMYETGIPPDMVTMNAVLCFFCKVGMMDVALELYNSRSQFGLSPDHMAYKYLILTLCWDGNVNEAYSVLRSSVDQGYFPDRLTFSTLASALCRECKIEEMKELLHLALGQNFMPNASTYDKFISALSRAGRVGDVYLFHGELNSVIARVSYVRMIKGFVKLNRGDIAARLLIEMQGKGHKLTRPLCKAVICCLLDMDNPRANVFNLLEVLTHREPHCKIYNCFIDAAVLANKADLAREVIELMQRKGIKPNEDSKILMLKSCLKSGRISDALNLFNNLQCQALVSRKLYNTLIVGLCKANMADIAHEFLFKMIKAGSTPSIECYEELVQQLCSSKRYHEAINIVNVHERMGRRVTSFLGNVLLFHSLVSPKVYDTCVRFIGVKEGTFSGISMLSLIIGVFSGRLRVNYSIEDLEELIGKCFSLDIYTYNLLLRKVSKSDMDQACELFDRMCKRGYEPNWWTYDIMVHGFSKQGRKDEAKRWVKEMCRKGLYPAESD